MAGRARLYYANKTNGAISWQYNLLMNATMLQWIANWSAVSNTSEHFRIRKLSGVHTDFDVTLVDLNPFSDSTAEYVCTGNYWEFRRADTLEITYANTNGNLIAFEAVFREAD
jgi:hypothetical protein